MDAQELISPIAAAVKPVLTKWGGDAKDYVDGESVKMATTLANIAKLRASGQIDNDQAAALLDMQKHAMQTVFLTVEGIGLIAAQQAVEAGLQAVKDIVNKGIGFALL
jgi:hypothetical protein